MTAEIEIVTIRSHDDEALLEEFHAGIYWDAFADQEEPLVVWKRALWSGASPYELTIRIAGRALRDRVRRQVLGGIVFERYPGCGCGLITYIVVAPPARRQGLGKRLQSEAAATLFAAGAPAVFSELRDPRHVGDDTPEPPHETWRRIERNQAWGARVLDMRYVQPALAPGLTRDSRLCLIAIPGAQPLPGSIPGALVRDFVDELFTVTEGSSPDHTLFGGIAEHIALIELRR
jgi:GNAT superfamily N-acetyltransferase